MRFFFLLLLFPSLLLAQTPLFGPEIAVTINSYTIDAMEPFISTDGNALFFNSINNNTNTTIFYAGKIDDTTFNAIGPLPVVNQTVTPFLNAVASIDTDTTFYWITTRNYPADYDNLHHVSFRQAGPVNFGPIRGDFNIHIPGWLIMDAAINYNGNYLYYCNAFFQGTTCNGGLPCKGRLGVAQKVNDSTFNKLPNTDLIMATVNDTNYVVYAPHISSDGLELYYTRFSQSALLNTEICVAVRTGTLQVFGTPVVIYSANGFAPEAPTLSTDKNKLYYHKTQGGIYKIFMRYRTGYVGVGEKEKKKFSCYLDGKKLLINKDGSASTMIVELINNEGKIIFSKQLNTEEKSIDLEKYNLTNGIYFVNLKTESNSTTKKIAIID